jgi:homoserine/homoserine lactone efflux protein
LYLSGMEWLSFIGIVILLVIFPGPNTVLILRSAGLSGRRAGLSGVAGIAAALYVHAAASVLGLSVLISTSTALYRAMKILGAGYLIYLGIRDIVNAIGTKHPASAGPEPPAPADEAGFGSSFLKGFVSNLLNPKVALFFISLFPQFIREPQSAWIDSLLLTVVYSLISAAWYITLTFLAAGLSRWLERDAVQRRIKFCSGLLLTGLGAKVMAER